MHKRLLTKFCPHFPPIGYICDECREVRDKKLAEYRRMPNSTRPKSFFDYYKRPRNLNTLWKKNDENDTCKPDNPAFLAGIVNPNHNIADPVTEKQVLLIRIPDEFENDDVGNLKKKWKKDDENAECVEKIGKYNHEQEDQICESEVILIKISGDCDSSAFMKQKPWFDTQVLQDTINLTSKVNVSWLPEIQ